MQKVFALLFLFSACIMNMHAQSIETYADTIPYEIVRGKIVVTLEIDKKSARFVFDTGGRNLLVYDSLQVYPSISLTGQTEGVSDFNGISSHLPKAVASEINIGKGTITQVPFVVMANNNSFRAMGVSGLISGELLKEFSVKINSREKVITLSYPYRPKGMSRKDAISIKMDPNLRPSIPLNIGSTTIHALFDTGAHGFLLLSEADCRKLQSAGDLVVETEGNGIISIGQGGMKNAIPSPISKYNIKQMSVKDKQFLDVGGLTMPGFTSIIGYDLLRYGEVLIDYPRNFFYFIPFDSQPANLKDETKVWNVKILPVNGHFEITAVIGESDAKMGDKVWEIDGISLENLELDEMLISEILEKAPSNEIQIQVGDTKKQARRITIKKF